MHQMMQLGIEPDHQGSDEGCKGNPRRKVGGRHSKSKLYFFRSLSAAADDGEAKS